MPTVIASLRSNPETLIVSNLCKLVIGRNEAIWKKSKMDCFVPRNDENV